MTRQLACKGPRGGLQAGRTDIMPSLRALYAGGNQAPTAACTQTETQSATRLFLNKPWCGDAGTDEGEPESQRAATSNWASTPTERTPAGGGPLSEIGPDVTAGGPDGGSLGGDPPPVAEH
eukprot:156415-Prorocentrum_minimum.AAC.1